MSDFLDGDGIFLGVPNPQPIPAHDLDLGETTKSAYTGEAFWGKSAGIVFPLQITDRVAIGSMATLYDEKLHVAGKILSQGYNLSDTVYITKDGSNNLVFTDPVAGSRTLSQLIGGAGAGNVIAVGTPTNLQLAQWTDSTHIQGIAISSLTLTQSQITGLVTALAGKAATIHNLIDPTNHPVTGLTTGYFLKALSATTYGFSVHGLTKSDIGLSNVTNDAQIKKIASATNNALARWDGATGDQIKNSVATLGDDGSINIPTGATYNINGANHTHAGQYQIADATLSALSNLDGSSGFVYQTGADTFTKYDFGGTGAANTVSRSDHNHSGTYLTANQNITLTSDVTGSGATSIVVTLSTVNANVFGSNTFLKFTVNGKGLVTAAVAVAESDIQSTFGSKTANYVYASPSGSAGNPTFRALVALDIPTIAQSQVTNLTTDLSGKQAADAKLTTYSALATSTGYLYNNGSGTLSWGTPGGGGNVSSSGTPTSGQLAQWISSSAIQGIAQSSLATDAFGALTDITTNNATSVLHGFLPKLGGGITNFLRADGTWAAPGATAPADGIWDWDSTAYAPYASKQTTLQHFYLGTSNPDQTTRLNMDAYFYATQLYDNATRVLTANQTITLSSDVTGSGTTSITTTIANNVVTYGKFQQVAALSVVGNATSSPANSSAITGIASQVLQVNSGATALAFVSIANAFGSQTQNYFWAAPTGASGVPTFRAVVKSDLSGAAIAYTDSANTFGDFNNIFRSSRLIITNPANTFNYTFIGSAIGAARNITLPLLTGDDTIVTASYIQTLTNKTINAVDNTITDTSAIVGDLLKHNGTKFVRFAKGAALYVLRVNAGGTDLEYINPPWLTSNGITPAALTKVDDTNVTLTLGGTPATSLLQAVSLTLGWTGTLADGRIASAAAWNAKGNVSNTGTPTNDQITVWANATTIEGTSGLTWNGALLGVIGDIQISNKVNVNHVGEYTPTHGIVYDNAIYTLASTITVAGLNVPHGTAPTSPVNGDIWTTAVGMYARINGTTIGPFGGVTPTDDILDWVSTQYAPYTAAGAGHFYSGTGSPTNNNRLNYDGYFYATNLYAIGTVIATSDIISGSSAANHIQLTNTTFNIKNNTTYYTILYPSVANSGTNTAYIFDTANALTGSTKLVSFRNQTVEKFSIDNAGNFLVAGALDSGTAATYGRIGNNYLEVIVASSQKFIVDPSVTDSSTAKAIYLTTTNTLANSTAKLMSLANNGTEKISVDKDGNVNIPTGSNYKINGTNIGGWPAAAGIAVYSGSSSWSTSLGVTNNVDNTVVTFTGSGFNGESNLTFNGSTLTITGAISQSGGNLSLQDAGTTDVSAVRVISSGGSLYLQSGSGDNIIFRNKTAIETMRISDGGAVTVYYGGVFKVDGSRPITTNPTNGNVIIKASAGGWDIQYGFQGSAGTAKGAFGAFGSTDSLSYWYIGNGYNDVQATFYPGGASNLYYNNVVKLATTSTGVDITGRLIQTVSHSGNVALSVENTHSTNGYGAAIRGSNGASGYILQLQDYASTVCHTFRADGTVVSTGSYTATAFVVSSDKRLKTKISAIDPTKRLDINYKQFELKSDLGQIRYGVIGQEVEKNYPELVRTDGLGMRSVAYTDLLIREVAYLKNKVEELENKIMSAV